MTALGLLVLASNIIYFRARWPQRSDFPTSSTLDPTTLLSLSKYLCSSAVPCPSARSNCTVGKTRGRHSRSPKATLSPTQTPACPAVGCCPSRVPRAGHRSVSKRREAKVPSVSLKQMLHRDDSKSLLRERRGEIGRRQLNSCFK